VVAVLKVVDLGEEDKMGYGYGKPKKKGPKKPKKRGK